jgi:hypothetical protein
MNSKKQLLKALIKVCLGVGAGGILFGFMILDFGFTFTI